MDDVEMEALKTNSTPLNGACAGVFFLFSGDDLVHIGQAWNCLLRIAEYAGKEPIKEFDRWNFVPLESELQRKRMVRELKDKYKIKYSRDV